MEAFTELFDRWAASYDQTVYGRNHEYAEVFESYENILDKICQLAADKWPGTVLEIGMGTGNLGRKFGSRGWSVVGVDPSPEMRKIAAKKIPEAVILDGHFLSVPAAVETDVIVSSYAMHHLPHFKKTQAIQYLDAFLKPGGKFIIADTMFESAQYRATLLEEAEENGYYDLLNDLNTEYYEEVQAVMEMFLSLGYRCSCTKQNKYVWIIAAEKAGSPTKGW